MLKLTYSDADLSIEYLALPVEDVVTQRTIVALRAGHPLAIQPGYGSFTLPTDLPGITALRTRGRGAIAIAPCDHNWLEITLRGTWLTDCTPRGEVILVAELGADLEQRLVILWARSHRPQVAYSEAARGL